jgi:HEAT repeat protein
MCRTSLVIALFSLLWPSVLVEAQISRPRSTPAAINEQIAALSSPDPAARALAACYLGGMGRRASAAVPALMRLLSEATSIDPIACQGDAFWAMSFTGRMKSSPGLEAARALGFIGETALEPLLQVVGQDNPVVRRHVAHALGFIRTESSLTAVLRLAKDPDASVRGEAAAGLGRHGDRRALDPLVALARDSSAEVRQQATRALGQLRQGDVVQVLLDKTRDADERVRWEAVTALGHGRYQGNSSDGAVTTLIAALGDQSPWVRERAAQVLGRFRDERAVQPLVTLLKDSDPEVREEVVTALGRFAETQATDSLIAALKDPDAGVRERAARALSKGRHRQ